MDDFVLNVRQILQYDRQLTVLPADGFLLQTGSVGGPYRWASVPDMLRTALQPGGFLNLAPNGLGGVAFNGAALTFDGINNQFVCSEEVRAPQFFVDDPRGIPYSGPVATIDYADFLYTNSVHSFNGRTGRVMLEVGDILRAGGAPILNPHLLGWATSTEPFSPDVDDQSIATCHWVHRAFRCDVLRFGVASFNGRQGNILLNADDISFACTQPGAQPRTNTPPSGDASTRIASTMFVDDGLANLKTYVDDELQTWTQTIVNTALQNYAPLNSPQFTGFPSAPTAAPGANTGQLATTAFVQQAIVASTTGVASFNSRTGAVVLSNADVVAAGGATLASPAFTGLPTAPTATLGTNTAQLATTAFVLAELATVSIGVVSFNSRTGAVVLTTADVTGVGGAPIASPVFTGDPRAPTPAPGDNDTSIATTAWVTNALAGLPAPVTSFNSRTGAITLQANDISAAGGALLNSPAFTGVPTSTTPAPGDNSAQIATTAFVHAAVTAGSAGVSSFNSRTGAVSLTAGDVSGVGGALLASPLFSGVPAAPTATAGTNTTQLATTAFVQAALAAAPGGVSSFNLRTGAITLLGTDISAAGGALLASPALTGTPTAPTPVSTDNSTLLATTAFVRNAIVSGGGVSSFNGRAGAITLTAADIISASGATYAQADAAPAVGPNQKLWFNSLNGNLYVQYTDPSTTARSWVVANNPPPVAAPSGSRVLITAVDITTPVATVDFFNGFDGTYDNLELVISDVVLASEQNVLVRFSADGSTFDASANAYVSNYMFLTSAGGTVGGTSVAAAFGQLSQFGAAVSFPQQLIMNIRRPPVAGARAHLHYRGDWQNAGSGYVTGSGGIAWANTSYPALLGLRILINTGVLINRGSFRLYGIAK